MPAVVQPRVLGQLARRYARTASGRNTTKIPASQSALFHRLSPIGPPRASARMSYGLLSALSWGISTLLAEALAGIANHVAARRTRLWDAAA